MVFDVHYCLFTFRVNGGIKGGKTQSRNMVMPPKMKLTYIKCKSVKPSAKSVKMSDGGGMHLEVMPNGSKYWRLKFRIKVEGKLKEKRLALGVYAPNEIRFSFFS